MFITGRTVIILLPYAEGSMMIVKPFSILEGDGQTELLYEYRASALLC